MKLKKNVEVYAPTTGVAQWISSCKDSCFAQKMMGDGAILFPEEDNIVAPFDGIVQCVFPTNHAISIQSMDGVTVLIHVGLNIDDIAKLNIFKSVVKEQQFVAKGDMLIEYSLQELLSYDEDASIPVVFTNLDGNNLIFESGKKYTKLEKLLEVQ